MPLNPQKENKEKKKVLNQKGTFFCISFIIIVNWRSPLRALFPCSQR